MKEEWELLEATTCSRTDEHGRGCGYLEAGHMIQAAVLFDSYPYLAHYNYEATDNAQILYLSKSVIDQAY